MQKEFWYKRHVEARRWVWLQMISNTVFQLRAIANPYTDIHYKVNLGYTIYNLVVVCLLIMSYLRKANSILVLPALILANFRQVIRFLDLEDLKPQTTCNEEEANQNLMQPDTWNLVLIT